MAKHISKRSLVAILFACVWGMIVLCLSLPACPAGKAHAAGLMDREIFIMATDLDSPGGGSAGETYEWGSFYRGTGILSAVSYEPSGSGQGGTIEWDDIDNDNGEVYLTISDRNDSLYNHGDRHDFIDADFECIDESIHWAVCKDCGFKLQVAHRPDGDGMCQDCGEDLGEDYINSYIFTVPETILFDESELTEGDLPSFSVSLDAQLYAGVTLTLFVQCENGAIFSENGESLGYTISASDDCDYGTGESVDASTLTDTPQAIWELTVEEESDYDGTDDSRRKLINCTITITLELSESDLQDLVCTGDFTDTLIFSATLTEANE